MASYLANLMKRVVGEALKERNREIACLLDEGHQSIAKQLGEVNAQLGEVNALVKEMCRSTDEICHNLRVVRQGVAGQVAGQMERSSRLYLLQTYLFRREMRAKIARGEVLFQANTRGSAYAYKNSMRL